jgi:hypothetical protein
MNKKHVIPARSLHRLTGLILTMAAAGPSFGQTIIIDPMTPSQATISACPPVPNTVSSAVTNAAVWGGWRIMAANIQEGSGDPSECTTSIVAATNPPGWKIANPEKVIGNGRLTWSGSNSATGLAPVPLNLQYLQYFNFQYIGADHTSTFYIELWSGANACSIATIATVPANTSRENIQIPKASFSQCAGAASAVDFANIGRMSVSFDAVNAIDTEFRAITAIVNDPPAIACDYKTINGSSSLAVMTPGPYDNLTVAFKVDNTGGSPSAVTVQDLVPPGMTQTSALSCTNGLTFGNPKNPPITWDSTSPLAAGASSVCTFNARLESLEVGETKTNVVKASEIGQPASKQCQATITRGTPPPPPTPIPTMNDWAKMLTAGMLALFGGLALRRRAI